MLITTEFTENEKIAFSSYFNVWSINCECYMLTTCWYLLILPFGGLTQIYYNIELFLNFRDFLHKNPQNMNWNRDRLFILCDGRIKSEKKISYLKRWAHDSLQFTPLWNLTTLSCKERLKRIKQSIFLLYYSFSGAF